MPRSPTIERGILLTRFGFLQTVRYFSMLLFTNLMNWTKILPWIVFVFVVKSSVREILFEEALEVQA
jgi:hypothetical protein